MRTSSHEIAWFAALLEYLPQVETLSVTIDGDHIKTPGGDWHPILSMRLHVRSWFDALVIADELGLREVEGCTTTDARGESMWRTWSGWVPEASCKLPAVVEVTAAELERNLVVI